MPRKESPNFKAVHTVFMLVMFAVFVGLSLAGLSHAFNIGNSGGGTPDEGYVINTDAPQ